MDQDIRWKQRFANYSKALSQLERFVERGEALNELEEQGLIKAFEYTYELAWNTIKDFYEHQGEAGLQGSRDAIQLAFKRGLIQNGDVWMDMLKDRNRTSHSYNEKTADEIASSILSKYFYCFIELRTGLEYIINK
jgi:nucleotidyltransferase substrate binding protein (TIGR01987 family)